MMWALMLSGSVFCVSVFYLYRSYRTASDNVTVGTAQCTDTRPTLSGDRFLILDSDRLVDILDLTPSLANIKANLGLSDENWQKDALPFLKNYIQFVQRLPASESHHHAGDGGLVKHTLDVASLALTASTAQSWPPNAKTEDIAQKTAVWRYGIMCAAILHDVGKTITGFAVELYDSPIDHDHTLWIPDAGNMNDTGKHYYRVEFLPEKTAYKIHAEIAWTFFQTLVPTHVRQWIAASDPGLVVTLRNYLSGKKDDSALHEIIKHADMTSVSRDLKAGSRQRFASAKRTPLIETVMETLKEMLAERGAHFSIATTAGGDLFRKGDSVYMVAKHVPDYIRQFLRSTNHRSAASFPSDNQRIFDTLYEYGAIIPPDYDPYRAITNINVQFKKQDNSVISQNFTVLCFKLQTLYPDAADYPDEFVGDLTVSSEKRVMKPQTGPTRFASEAGVPATLPSPEIQSFKAAAPDERSAAAIPEDTETVAVNPADTGEASFLAVSPEPAGTPTADYSVNQDESFEKTAALPTPGSIDDLLQQFGLDNPQEEPQQNRAGGQTDPAPQTPKSAEPADTRPKSAAKTPGSIPKGKAQSDRIRALMGKSVAKPDNKTGPESALYLTESETAQAELKNIRQEKLQEPAEAPRPVFVAAAAAEGNVQRIIHNATPEDEAAIDRQLNTPAHTNLDDKKLQANEMGRVFLRWLADGLADGTIAVNRDTGKPAAVHFIEGGMLLVSPGIFREYNSGSFNKADPNCLGNQAQKGFESLHLHKRTARTGLMDCLSTSGTKLFKCYFIPEENLKHIIQSSSRPPNNTSLMLSEQNLMDMQS